MLNVSAMWADIRIGNMMGTLYASYLTQRYSFNAMLSYGKNEYDIDEHLTKNNVKMIGDRDQLRHMYKSYGPP